LFERSEIQMKKSDMNEQELHEAEVKSINRWYRWSYILIPLPMLLGVVLAAYAYLTEEDHIDCYCVVAAQSQAYAIQPLQDVEFGRREEMTVSQCRQLDDAIDGDDGRSLGRVRWFVCTGMSCGPGWKGILAE